MRKRDEALNQKRKLQIVEAAIKCFVKKGFHQTTMREICAEAGMSPGSVYRFLSSKEEIIQAAADHDNQWLVDQMIKIGCTKNVKQQLLMVMMQFIRQSNGEGESKLLADIFAEAARNMKINKIVRRDDQVMLDAFTSLFAKLLEEGKIKSNFLAKELAELMVVFLNGYAGRIILQKRLNFKRISSLLQKLLSKVIVFV